MPFETIAPPVGGLDDCEPLVLEEGYSPDLQNVRFYRNRVERRSGLTPWEVSGAERISLSLLQASFEQPTGSGAFGQLISIDRDGFGIWQPSTRTWQIFLLDAGGFSDRFTNINTLSAVYSTALAAGMKIRRWDGTALTYLAEDLTDGSSNPVNLAALTLLPFGNRIVAVRTMENNIEHPTRVRWPANGQETAWDLSHDGAGFLDVRETSDAPLTGGFVLNGRAYLTRDKEILELINTGNSQAIFQAQTRVQGKGMRCPYSWAAADYFGFFVGADNVYRWDGSNLVAVGDRVKETIFEEGLLPLGAAPFGAAILARGIVFADRQEYWLLFPPISTGTNRLFIYNYQRDQWYPDVYANLDALLEFCAVDPQLLAPAVTAPRQEVVLLSQNSIFSAGRGGHVFLNPAALSDTPNGAVPPPTFPIDSYVVTKDYNAKEIIASKMSTTYQPTTLKLNVLHQVRFQSTPNTEFEIGMSPDRGASWITTFARANDQGVAAAYFIQPYATIRFRFRSMSVGPCPLFGQVTYQWKPAGMNISQ